MFLEAASAGIPVMFNESNRVEAKSCRYRKPCNYRREVAVSCTESDCRKQGGNSENPNEWRVEERSAAKGTMLDLSTQCKVWV